MSISLAGLLGGDSILFKCPKTITFCTDAVVVSASHFELGVAGLDLPFLSKKGQASVAWNKCWQKRHCVVAGDVNLGHA